MTTKTLYEYEVVIGDNTFNFPRDNRQSARNTMKEWKESGFDAKIVQRKYELVTEKVQRKYELVTEKVVR